MSIDSITHGPDGRIVEQVTDHGDGTATRTRWPAPGADPVTDTITAPLPEPPAPDVAGVLGRLAAADPAMLDLAVGVGARVALAAGDLVQALGDIAPTNTTRPWIQAVTEIAVEAALAATDPPPAP